MNNPPTPIFPDRWYKAQCHQFEKLSQLYLSFPLPSIISILDSHCRMGHACIASWRPGQGTVTQIHAPRNSFDTPSKETFDQLQEAHQGWWLGSESIFWALLNGYLIIEDTLYIDSWSKKRLWIFPTELHRLTSLSSWLMLVIWSHMILFLICIHWYNNCEYLR